MNVTGHAAEGWQLGIGVATAASGGTSIRSSSRFATPFGPAAINATAPSTGGTANHPGNGSREFSTINETAHSNRPIDDALWALSFRSTHLPEAAIASPAPAASSHMRLVGQ